MLGMGLMDKAKELLGQNDEKVDQGLDKLGGVAGQKFGHENEVGQGVDQLKRMTGDGDTTAVPPAAEQLPPAAEGEAPVPAEGQLPPPAQGQVPPPPAE